MARRGSGQASDKGGPRGVTGVRDKNAHQMTYGKPTDDGIHWRTWKH